jgi:hypothetical protein
MCVCIYVILCSERECKIPVRRKWNYACFTYKPTETLGLLNDVVNIPYGGHPSSESAYIAQKNDGDIIERDLNV